MRQAADVVQAVLDHGKLRQPDILAACASSSLDNPKDVSLRSQALHKLVLASYLKATTPRSLISPRDQIIKYEEEEKAKIPGLPTSGQLREAREQAVARIRLEKEQEESIGLVSAFYKLLFLSLNRSFTAFSMS